MPLHKPRATKLVAPQLQYKHMPTIAFINQVENNCNGKMNKNSKFSLSVPSIVTPITTVTTQGENYNGHFKSYQHVKRWLIENFRNYCSTTSLHGFNYITRNDLNRGERIFWICIVIISIVVSIALVMMSWHWSRETLTVTVIESSHYPTWNIRFPAVTICNFNKLSKRKAMVLVKQLKRPSNMTEEQLLKLFHLTMYFSFAYGYTQQDYLQFENMLQLNNLTLQDVSALLQPNCMEMISKCIWKGDNTRCESIFQSVATAEGTCCSFNYYGTPMNNFPRKIAYQIPKQPYRVTGCGYPTGLSVLLNPLRDDYFGTYFSSYGFRLLIHDAFNYPTENSETKIITSTRESFVRINPRSTYATRDVRDMAIPLRECLFFNERKLNVLQRYSFANCMTECRVQLLYKRCGCVPSSLPNNGTYPLCNVKQIQCMVKNRGERAPMCSPISVLCLSNLKFPIDLFTLKEIFTRALPNLDQTLTLVRNTAVFPCNCLPNCETNEYPSEITMGRLNVKLPIFNSDNQTKSVNEDDDILLHIFFSDLMSTRYRKEIFQNWLSALASFGGLLGLIMGFSIVSAFEFVYFLTFRPIFNYFS